MSETPDPELVAFALEHAPAVYLAGQVDGGLVLDYVGPGCARLTGLRGDGLLGAGAFEARLRRADREALREALERLTRIDLVRVPLRICASREAPRWFELSLRRSAGNRVLGALDPLAGPPESEPGPGTQGGQNRERVHRRLMEALETIPSALGVLDHRGRLILCNSAFAAPYGLSAAALVGMDRRALARSFLGNVTRIDERRVTGSERDIEWWAERMTHYDGPPVEVELASGEWKLLSATPMPDGGLAVVRTDITLRKRMEQALRDSESLVRQVLEACPAPVSMTRLADGRALYENPASITLFGAHPCSGGEPGRSEFADPVQGQAFTAALAATRAVDAFEVDVIRADGQRVPVSLSARLIQYRGEPVIVATALDLRQRREMEEILDRQREALHQSEKLSALGELLASVAHELNNPLSVVVGQALLMKETAGDPRIVERAGRIGDAAERCARIVKAFLAMARQQPLERTLLDPARVLRAAIALVEEALRSDGIVLQQHIAGSLPPIKGDEGQLVQVLVNLVTNALHALHEHHGVRRVQIAASYRERTREVVLKVKDTGPGVPEEIRSRIYEPLFTTRKVGAGTGLGLAVCHRIIDAHGGILHLEDSPDGGATFSIRLPVADDRRAGTAVAPQDPSRPRPLQVLVLDDEPEVARMLAEIAVSEGHRPHVAHSAAAAFELLARRPVDVILSDMRMPDRDGQAFFEELGRRHPRLCARVVFVTGDTLTPRVRRFLERSRRPQLEKPVRPAELREVLRRVGDTVPPATEPVTDREHQVCREDQG
jgi:PAS domain S-box-containing protein